MVTKTSEITRAKMIPDAYGITPVKGYSPRMTPPSPATPAALNTASTSRREERE
jgi:hypothetical protein